MPRFPEVGEVFMQLLDGWHPIAASDLDTYQEALQAIQEALGAGPVDVGANNFGPSASNTDLAERLGKFLEPDGALKDVVFMTGTTPLGAFSENTGTGHYIGFPKSISIGGEGIDSYFTLFAPRMSETYESGLYKVEVPAIWAPTSRSTNGVTIMARNMDGSAISSADSTSIQWSLLVVGYDAFIEN